MRKSLKKTTPFSLKRRLNPKKKNPLSEKYLKKLRPPRLEGIVHKSEIKKSK
jgi:hypothetical protein